jgi:hypothetical protein
MNKKIDKDNLGLELVRLRNTVDCQRCYRCIYEPVKNICKAQYEAHTDSMLCLDPSAPDCNMAARQGNQIYCRCPLRKFIALNFSRLYPTCAGTLAEALPD